MSSKQICKDALATFGAEPQIKKCLEELNELAVAIYHYTDGKDTIEHVAEEIADVEIMLQQMTLLWRCQTIVEEQRRIKLQSLRQKVLLAKPEEDAPVTIADRIRAMNDQELASKIVKLQDLDGAFCMRKKECYDALSHDEDILEERCEDCALAWLRRPAEEVQNNG